MTQNKRLERLILAALMTALITVLTIIVAIPVPIVNGYVHLGDSMIFLAVLVLGWKYGAIAAALGSALADLYLGYAFYAPWTFFIKGGMALLMGLLIYEALKSKKHTAFVALLVAGLWFVLSALTLFATRENGDMQVGVMVASFVIPLVLIISVFLLERNSKMKISFPYILGMMGGGLFMVFGYFISGGVMYGNWVTSAVGIPPNVIQFVVGFVIAMLVQMVLAKTPLRKELYYEK